MRRHSVVGLHDLGASGGGSLLAAIAALEADDGDKKERTAA
jgi:hypothetical protein